MEVTLTAGKLYSFVSPKGGSGKTITAVTMAMVLAGLNKSVLVVDADASTNGLSLFYLDKITTYKSEMAGTLSGTFDTDAPGDIQPISVATGVDVAPASFVMIQTEKASTEKFRNRLETMLLAWRGRYDYVFLDSQAGTDEFAENTVELADEIVIVSEYDPMSAQGIERLRILFNNAIAQKPVWTLFNKVLPEFVQGIGEFLSVARYLVPIPWDADVVRAYVRRTSPVDMVNGNTHTLSAIQSALSLFGREIENEVNVWRKERVDLIRKPAAEKLDEVENLIGNLEERKVYIKYRRRRIFRTIGMGAGLYFVSIGMFILLFPLSSETISNPFVAIFGLFFGNRFRELTPNDLGVFITIVGLGVLAFFPRMLANLFGGEDEKSERARVGIDLELQRLREERGRLRALSNIDLGDIFNVRR